MTADEKKSLMTAAKSIANTPFNCTYPSRASAQYVRETMKKMIALVEEQDTCMKQSQQISERFPGEMI